MKNEDVNPELVFQQGMQAYQSGNFGLAEIMMRQVAAHLPENDGILTTLGGILLASHKMEEGINYLQKAIQINPQNIDAQTNLAIAYQSTGKVEESLQNFEQLIMLAPDREDIHFNYANALLQVQQYDKAVDILEKVIQINPQFAQAYQTLATIYAFQQKIEQAAAMYQKILDIAPEDMNTIANLGNLYADHGLSEQAIVTYQTGINYHPNHFLPYALLGKYYSENGQEQGGEELLRKALDLNPDDVNTNILLGNICKNLGKTDEAENCYKKALQLDPNHEGAKRNLSRILSTKIPYWHFEMLADTARNDAYQKAIEKVITPDTKVLDIGTGSGLLSMMAARAGAKSIVACEMHEGLAETAQEIIRANQYENQITVFNKKSNELKIGAELEEHVEVIISEILDVGVLGEGVLPSLRHAVQNLAKKDVHLIPAKVKVFGQLIEIPARSRVVPVREISGFDLSVFNKYRIENEYHRIILKSEKYKVLSAVIPLIEFDFYHLPPAFPDDRPRQIPFQIPITESGELQAMVFWFDLYLNEEIMVSSRPDGALEHWGQALFCFSNPKSVQKGALQTVMMLQSDVLIQFTI